MTSLNSFQTNVFQINKQNFDDHALRLFLYQSANNHIYREYIRYLGINPFNIQHLDQVPFLPIQFFKHHQVTTEAAAHAHVFESSGTTGVTSKHYIHDLSFYTRVSASIFTDFFGQLQGSVVIGLLPSYLERGNSSLVYMVNHFIAMSKHRLSGFYLHHQDELAKKLESLRGSDVPVYLFGVTFALLDMAKNHPIDIGNVHIIETGGMKGRGEELTREALHGILKSAFNTPRVYSEYGMTELLSQAYLGNEDLFKSPEWMKVKIRDMYDPFSYVKEGKTGGINVIDLANAHSCAFIETEDIGVAEQDGFKVLGRMDNSDLRGCNLLIS
ncbi:MAG: acyl transferase [Cyclobacteriaceae bacterium]|nr:acyl transferase [Cyclobacteriaceae bacterium]